MANRSSSKSKALLPLKNSWTHIVNVKEYITLLTKLTANNVRFLFDGERIHETQTPKNMNMENGD